MKFDLKKIKIYSFTVSLHELGGQRRQVELAVSKNTRQQIRAQGDVQTGGAVVLRVCTPVRSIRHQLNSKQGIKKLFQKFFFHEL
jgi:hypothetical protein